MAKNSLAKLALMLGLPFLGGVKKAQADPQFYLGLSAPCHGLLALRVEYQFDNTFGVQSDLGLISGIDFRAGISDPYLTDPITHKKTNIKIPGDFYIYAGALGISPWTYLLADKSQADGPTIAVDVGVGVKEQLSLPAYKNKKWGWNKTDFYLGVEGGLVLPIPSDPDTMAFRIDVNGTWKIANKKK